MVRNGCRFVNGNYRVTKAWLPQKYRFYAGLKVVLGVSNQVTIKNTHLYTEKNILQSLY